MNVRVFTIPFDSTRGVFDDQELQAFQEGRDVLSLSDHLVQVAGVPVLALVVSWRPSPTARHRHPPSAREQAPSVVVSAEHEPAFVALKRWRNDRARRDGRPPYVIFTNQQLATIAALPEPTRESLATIPGVGEARIREYADELLAVLLVVANGG